MNRSADIVEFDTIDSTNSEAHRRASGGERGPLWIRADRQEQGRGRSGRAWSSPPGNLSATFMFVPGCERSRLHELSFVAGIAAFEAVRGHLDKPETLKLKWPNDLMIDAAKVGGILVESSKYGSDVVVMIGIGINIAVTPDVDGRAVTRLDEHGRGPKPAELHGDLARAMQQWLSVWDDGSGFEAIRSAWMDRAYPPGQAVTVNTVNARLDGTFHGLADNGALLLEVAGSELISVDHGDVVLAGEVPTKELQP